jgi:hypothetical protein
MTSEQSLEIESEKIWKCTKSEMHVKFGAKLGYIKRKGKPQYYFIIINGAQLANSFSNLNLAIHHVDQIVAGEVQPSHLREFAKKIGAKWPERERRNAGSRAEPVGDDGPPPPGPKVS